MNRRTHHDRMPVVDTCCVPLYDGSPCGQPSHPVAPFAICGPHARKVWDRFNEFLESTKHNEISRAALIINEAQALQKKHAEELVDSRIGIVYYVQIGEHIKIGYTANLPQRMRQYPPNRRVLATEGGGWDRESQRHREFRHLLDMGNEWFRPGPDLIAHINDLRAEQGAQPVTFAA